MTVSRRYLPASLACLITLSAANAAFAGGSALDPYAAIPAPTTLKSNTKGSKGKKTKNVPLAKKAERLDDKLVQDDSSQTYVKSVGSGKSKHIKQQVETALAPEPKPEKIKAKKEKVKAEPLTSTKVSDVAPVKEKVKDKEKELAPVKEAKAAPAGSNEDGVMGGIKTIGEGYSKTFKAASHGVVAGSKKMGSGIKSGAKASGDAFKKGAEVVGHGFKSTGEKIKEGAAPIGEKLAKAPAAAAKGVKAASEKTKEGTESLGSKIAHMPKPKMKMPKISFHGKKKSASDPNAGASPQGLAPEASVAASPKDAPLDAPIKQTPVGEPLQTAEAPPPLKKEKHKSGDNKIKTAGQSLANASGSVGKKIGKLWPFGHKNTAAPAADVAGKQPQPSM